MTGDEKCCLCRTDCSMRINTRTKVTTFRYECPVCGPFTISRPAKLKCEYDPIWREKAACVAAERRLKTMGEYCIHSRPVDDDGSAAYPTVTLESLVALYPRSSLALLDRALLNLSNMVGHPGDKIKLSTERPTVLFSRTEEELLYVINQFYKLGYIGLGSDIPEHVLKSPGGDPIARHLIANEFTIQADGWRRLVELDRTSVGGEPQAFVAMWFDSSTDSIYDRGIEPAIETDCGIKCVKIDNVEHNNKICDEIVAEIRRSKFVVADFTAGCCKMCNTCDFREGCKDKVRPRGGVYFEARNIGVSP